jgi:UDP-glucose 4-epimerase
MAWIIPPPTARASRDYIHVADLAQAHILGLAPGKRGFFNLGNGDGYSVRQVLATCERVSGKKFPRWKNRGGPRSTKAGGAADKARRELGWHPQFPQLEDMVASAWRWHQRHPQGYPD